MPSALLRAAWAAIATAGAASAATMTVSCDLLPPVVTLTLFSPQASPAATCPQFNPALGNLTNVIYVEEFDVLAATIRIRNLTAAPYFLSVAPVTFTTRIGPLPGSLATSSSIEAVLFANGVIPPGEAATFPLTVQGQAAFLSRDANLGGMIGTGSFHVPITLSSSGFSRTPQGLLLESYSMTLVQSGSSYLSYIYDPVPEPATWASALCAIGLIVLVNRQRHRRRALT
jgi:hypothetical protein